MFLCVCVPHKKQPQNIMKSLKAEMFSCFIFGRFLPDKIFNCSPYLQGDCGKPKTKGPSRHPPNITKNSAYEFTVALYTFNKYC